MLQVTSIRDITRSSTSIGGGPGRLLALKLTDGKTSCKAVEYKKVDALNDNLPPGTKVVLTSAQVKMGVILLESKCIKVRMHAPAQWLTTWILWTAMYQDSSLPHHCHHVQAIRLHDGLHLAAYMPHAGCAVSWEDGCVESGNHLNAMVTAMLHLMHYIIQGLCSLAAEANVCGCDRCWVVVWRRLHKTGRFRRSMEVQPKGLRVLVMTMTLHRLSGISFQVSWQSLHTVSYSWFCRFMLLMLHRQMLILWR